nr:putative reverse transcriptase domain, ribonuclease H-like domain, aspartic peptidase domain protein [Tanacetum cinerariifolium]
MRELVVKYMAEKVCHEEMIKMPLVDLKVLEDGSFRMCLDYRELSKTDLYSGCHQIRVHKDEILKTAFRMCYGRYEFTAIPFGLTNTPTIFMDVYTKSKEEHESHLKMNLKLLKKEKCHVKPNKVEAEMLAYMKREGGCLYDVTTGDSCEERHDSCYGLRRDVRTLIMEEAYTTKYSVRPGAEIEESKMIGLEMEQETTNVVVIKKRLKEAKDRIVRFGKKGELAPRYVGPLKILKRISPVAYRLRITRWAEYRELLGPLQSSSILFEFTSKILNLDDPSPDINSLMNTTTIPPPPPLVNPSLHPTTIPQQQTLDSITTTITYPTTTLPEILKFASLFHFDQRVSALETKVFEFNQTSQFAEAVSSIPSIVDNYLASKLKEEVNVAVRLQSNQLKEEAKAENQEFINQVDSIMKQIIKEQVKA